MRERFGYANLSARRLCLGLALGLFATALFAFAAHGFRFTLRARINRTDKSVRRKEIERSHELLNVIHAKKVTVYYADADYEYAKAACGIISAYLPLLGDNFGLSETPHVKLIIYPEREAMYTAIGYKSVESGEGGSGPSGAYSSGVLAVLSPSEWSGDAKDGEIGAFISEGTVLHELCHLLLDEKTNGNYSRWFAEGTALYYENVYIGRKPDGGTPQSPVSYRELSESFKYVDEKESYRKSFRIIEFIVDESGEKTLKKIYGELEGGKSLNGVLKRVLGGSLSSLDKL